MTQAPLTSDNGTTVRSRVVVDVWLFALLFDKLAFDREVPTPLGILTLALGAWALLSGSRQWAIAAFVADGLRLILLMPEVANHQSLLILVHVVLVVHLLRGQQDSVSDRALTQPLRAMAIVLYAAASIHKANESYLDPAVTCARVVLDQAVGTFGLPESGEGLATLSIWLGVGMELLLGLLLVVPRTRRIGVILGLAFHGSLAIHPHGGVSSFSVFMAALFVSFMDDPTLAALDGWRRRLTVVFERGTSTRVALVLAGTVMVALVSEFAQGAGPLISRPLAVVVCLGLLGVVLTTRADAKVDPESPRVGRGLTPTTIGVISLMIIAAALPYLGGRTQLAYSMFSNLRTEAAGNHEFLPTVSWFGYQDDLVEPAPDSDPIFYNVLEPGLSVPAYEVGRLLADAPHIDSLSFRSNGVDFSLSGPELRERFPAPGLLESRLFRLRRVEASGPVGCRH